MTQTRAAKYTGGTLPTKSTPQGTLLMRQLWQTNSSIMSHFKTTPTYHQAEEIFPRNCSIRTRFWVTFQCSLRHGQQKTQNYQWEQVSFAHAPKIERKSVLYFITKRIITSWQSVTRFKRNPSATAWGDKFQTQLPPSLIWNLIPVG